MDILNIGHMKNGDFANVDRVFYGADTSGVITGRRPTFPLHRCRANAQRFADHPHIAPRSFDASNLPTSNDILAWIVEPSPSAIVESEAIEALVSFARDHGGDATALANVYADAGYEPPAGSTLIVELIKDLSQVGDKKYRLTKLEKA